MKKAMFWEALRGYAASRRAMLLWGALCVPVFGLMCYFFGLPLDAVLYAALLCTVAGLGLASAGLWRYARRHRELSALLGGQVDALTPLPQPGSLLEGDYHALLARALAQRAETEEQAKREGRRQLETYSLWTHQIKVPISAMRLLLEGGTDQRSAAMLAELFKVEQYADMALNYARLNATSTDYVLKEYPLDDILRQLFRKFAPLFIQKKLALRYEPTKLRVLTDEKWLLFALEQVLSNAVKYSRTGSVTIAVDEQSQVLHFTDTGIGIDPGDLPRVFEQGYTGYNGRGDKRATGLGLYLCRQTLNKLGHSVELQSQVGVGTTVLIGLGREKTVYE